MWYANAAWWALGLAVLSFAGSCLSLYFTWWANYHGKQEEIARGLLSEGLAIHGLMEGWILEGPNYEQLKLLDHREVPSEPQIGALWLRRVEIRAVLDQAEWNTPEENFFNFIEGKRAWIVRDVLLKSQPSYPMVFARHYLDVKPHPALLSSKAMQELRAWIEKVASAYNSGLLSQAGLRMLSPFLDPVSGEDRVKVFRPVLSKEAQTFLEWHRTKYLK